MPVSWFFLHISRYYPLDVHFSGLPDPKMTSLLDEFSGAAEEEVAADEGIEGEHDPLVAEPPTTQLGQGKAKAKANAKPVDSDNDDEATGVPLQMKEWVEESRVVPVGLLRWDREHQYGQTRELDGDHILNLMTDLTATPPSELLRIVVWPDESMYPSLYPHSPQHLYLAN